MYTRNVGPTLGTGVRWFILASVLVLLVGALVAARLSRRLTKPLTDATEATARIAEGDLSVRLPDHRRRHAPTSSTTWPGRSTRWPTRWPGRAGSSSSSCCRCRTTCARRSRRSRATPRPSPTAPSPTTGPRPASSWPSPAGSSASSATCSTWPSSRPASSRSTWCRSTSTSWSATRSTGSAARSRPPACSCGWPDPARRVAAVADPDRLAQVVANLTENALKYASGSITLAVIADPVAPAGRGVRRRSRHRHRGPAPRVRAPLRGRPPTGAQGDRLRPRPGHRPRAGRRHGRHGPGRGRPRRRRPHGRDPAAGPASPPRPATRPAAGAAGVRVRHLRASSRSSAPPSRRPRRSDRAVGHEVTVNAPSAGGELGRVRYDANIAETSASTVASVVDRPLFVVCMFDAVDLTERCRKAATADLAGASDDELLDAAVELQRAARRARRGRGACAGRARRARGLRPSVWPSDRAVGGSRGQGGSGVGEAPGGHRAVVAPAPPCRRGVERRAHQRRSRPRS